MNRLRTSFVVTVAAVALTATACSDEVVTTNPPSPTECPTATPAAGEVCGADGLSCTFGECSETTATCAGGQWVVQSGFSCNPPPPCPSVLPEDGSDCSGYDPGPGCTFAVETNCGEQTATATCVVTPDGMNSWQVSTPACAGDCDTFADAEACDADSACRWLVPGCADECAGCPPASPEGCYPIGDCNAVDCGESETCTTVVHDPCWNSSCDACGAEVSVCLVSGI